MPSTDPLGSDPQIANRFLLEVDGVEIGVFQEVSGLTMNVESEQWKEGGQNGYSYQMIGRTTWPNLVFKRGITDGDSLYEWIHQVSGDGYAAADSKLERKTGAVTVIGYDGSRLRSWNFRDMVPVRWSGPSFSATSNELLEEELEVTHHGFDVKR